MNRRTLLASTAAAVAALRLGSPFAAHAEPGPTTTGKITHATIVKLAQRLADAPFKPNSKTLAPPFDNLNYDQYRAVRPRSRPLGGEMDRFSMDALPPGFFFKEPVEISTIGADGAQPILFSNDLFDFGEDQFDPAVIKEQTVATKTAADLGFSGFRLRYPINRPDVMDEFVVFQGASYFRAIGRDMLYGLSARGLAIATANPGGEEFPVFRKFWVEQPAPGARSVIVRALLDSPRCAGAFEFDIAPGEATEMTTRCTLFPRQKIDQIGIAPLTSMYFFGTEDRGRIDDFRNAVHDSSGLQMITGRGARLWRALSNPRRVEVSSFQDASPKGFGLVQRSRDFDHFQDAEARYERRPSAWVEPLDDWGPGAVMLVEIPTRDEFNDNIVAFWRPKDALGPTDAGHEFRYRLVWAATPPDSAPLARVAATRTGIAINNTNRRVIVIDFRKSPPWSENLAVKASASHGELIGLSHRTLPDSDIVRVSFEFDPGDERVIEFQLSLTAGDEPESETWMYRWTPS